MHHIDLQHVQALAAFLFAVGLGIVVIRRNLFFLLMGIELMLNAVNLSFVGFANTFPDGQSVVGQLTPVFIIAIAAAEACVGLSMLVCVVRSHNSLDADTFADMKE